ncbi:MAG: Ig-like domain-containing protein [Ruminococcus callidus]
MFQHEQKSTAQPQTAKTFDDSSAAALPSSAGVSVWLLFVPNHLNHVGETSVLQSSTADPGTAAVTSDSGTVQNSDAQAFLAVLEGNTAQLSAGKWKSSDESVATVDSNGTVTGVKQGSCQITDGSSTYRWMCAVWNSGKRERMWTVF